MAGSHGLLALREALAAVEAIPSAKNEVWHGGEVVRTIRRFARALVDTGGGDELQRRAALAGTPSGDVAEADGCKWLLAAHTAAASEGAVDSGNLPTDDVFRVERLRTNRGRLYVERIKAAARALVAWVETAESSRVGPGDFLDAAERFRRVRAETTARGDHALSLAVEHAARLVKRASDQRLIDLPAGIPWPPATTGLADQTGQWKLCWASVVKLIQVALPHETGSNPAALQVTRLPTDGAECLTLGCEKAEDWQPRAENYAEVARVLAERVKPPAVGDGDRDKPAKLPPSPPAESTSAPRIGRDEANIEARRVLKLRPPGRARLWTMRTLAKAIGFMRVDLLPAWQVYAQEKRVTRKAKGVVGRTVSLTDGVLANAGRRDDQLERVKDGLPNDSDVEAAITSANEQDPDAANEVVRRLIREQQADARSHRVRR